MLTAKRLHRGLLCQRLEVLSDTSTTLSKTELFADYRVKRTKCLVLDNLANVSLLRTVKSKEDSIKLTRFR